MAKKIKARRKFHVIATGYTADDFVALGSGPVYLQEGFTEDDISWHDSLATAMKHPAARDGYGAIERSKKLKAIDGQSEVQKLRVHAHKAREAEKILFDDVTDPLRIPFITADCAARSDGCTIHDVAQMIWDKHLEEVPSETLRTEARRQV